MKLPPVNKRRHGKLEDLTIHDLDPYLVVPDDALVGSPSDSEVVFVGPVGVGKTTAVDTLSSVMPINTEVVAAAPEEFYAPRKTTTTVGVDYGMWKRDDGSTVGLFGTAGQDRFSDSRAALKNPDAGIVLWVYGEISSLEQQFGEWLDAIGGPQITHRLSVALNFVEDGSLERAREILDSRGLSHVPVAIADPRVEEDVAHMVTLSLRFLEEEN